MKAIGIDTHKARWRRASSTSWEWPSRRGPSPTTRRATPALLAWALAEARRRDHRRGGLGRLRGGRWHASWWPAGSVSGRCRPSSAIASGCAPAGPARAIPADALAIARVTAPRGRPATGAPGRCDTRASSSCWRRARTSSPRRRGCATDSTPTWSCCCPATAPGPPTSWPSATAGPSGGCCARCAASRPSSPASGWPAWAGLAVAVKALELRLGGAGRRPCPVPAAGYRRAGGGPAHRRGRRRAPLPLGRRLRDAGRGGTDPGQLGTDPADAPQPGRQPPAQPGTPQHRPGAGLASPAGQGLHRAQAGRGQDLAGGAALPQAPSRPGRVPDPHRGRSRQRRWRLDKIGACHLSAPTRDLSRASQGRAFIASAFSAASMSSAANARA